MAARGALHLDEIAGAKILDTSGIEWLHRQRRFAVSFSPDKMPPIGSVSTPRHQKSAQLRPEPLALTIVNRDVSARDLRGTAARAWPGDGVRITSTSQPSPGPFFDR